MKYLLSGHYRQTPKERLQEIAESTPTETCADHYGTGEVITEFENKIAAVLGKPAAVFMPSGTMAQQIALRILTDQAASKRVGFHGTSHLEIHEHSAYLKLHGLESVLLGQSDRLITLSDLQMISEPLGALLLELPQREIGGLLPSWQDLVAQTQWAKEQGTRLHMDGARLWECQPFYQRPYSEICSLFDTVYVSFYKGLGGIAGAILAGPIDIIEEARVWQRRHGGNLISLYPYVLSADQCFEKRLGKMAAYHERAVEIAQCLKGLPGLRIQPELPQTNMMHVFFTAPKEKLEAEALQLAQDEKALIFKSLRKGLRPVEGTQECMFEISTGDASLDFPMDRLRGCFERVLKGALTI